MVKIVAIRKVFSAKNSPKCSGDRGGPGFTPDTAGRVYPDSHSAGKGTQNSKTLAICCRYFRT